MAISQHGSREPEGRAPERLIDWHDFETDGAVSDTVLEAVSDLKSCDESDLPPLADWMDRDALDSLLGDAGPQQPKLRDGELSFNYDGVSVTVDSIGMVRVVAGDA